MLIDSLRLQTYLEEAKIAAKRSGELFLKRFGKVEEVFYKGEDRDLFIDVDKKSEEMIFSHLIGAFPDHAFLGEESGSRIESSSDWTWVVDPLDGTSNYIHSFPYSVVSIALLYKGESVVGVVYNPFVDQIYYAVKGEGTFMNGRKLAVSSVSLLEDALLGTDSLFNVYPKTQEQYKLFVEFTHGSHGVRKVGAAALSLAYLSSGFLDGYWGLNFHPWDMAASALLITEAGGEVTSFDGGAFDPMKKTIIASNGSIHQALVEKLQNVFLEGYE